MKIKRKKKCIVCLKEFEYYMREHPAKRKTPVGVRGKNSNTCSKECSRVYLRIAGRIRNKIRYNKK